MSANDNQVGGTHYKARYEHWDFIEDVGMGYKEAQVVKYVTRHGRKGGIQDLEKAMHFLQKMEEERAKAIEHTLPEYREANELTDAQEDVIALLLMGDIGEAMARVATIMVTEYGDASPAYVDQD